jgi:SAM-dependent methyltransferase
MNWKLKAVVQNAIARLPASSSYAAYYWLQRNFGGWDHIEPTKWFVVAIEAWKRIGRLGHDAVDKVFFEIGTGRAPLVPIAFYLMGAAGTITIDVNPYLQDGLIQETLKWIDNNAEAMKALFGPLLLSERLKTLRSLRKRPFDREMFLAECGITYLAPADATNTSLRSASVDFHFSNTTLEHIPPDILGGILREGNRIIKDDGLFIHRIDYSDHFSHSDRRISRINFLQFSEKEWNRLAGNRYMYMNRLRHDDMVKAFGRAGHRIILEEPDVYRELLEPVEKGQLKLADRFAGKGEEVLATTGAWIVSSSAFQRNH